MKYQIYLKKESSEVLNAMAKKLNTKPATLIKEMLEPNLNWKFIEDNAKEPSKKKGK